jgi:hypothetical protein
MKTVVLVVVSIRTLAGCGANPEYYYQQHGGQAPVIGPFASAEICETARKEMNKEMEDAGYYIVTSSCWRGR